MSRTSLQRFHLHLRKLSYYRALNATTSFNSAAKDLSSELTIWREQVKPLYFSGPGTHSDTIIREWDGTSYSIVKLNALQISVQIEQHMQALNESTTAFFADRTEALTSPEVRFIFDNSENIMNYFTAVRKAEIEEHFNFIVTLRTALLCCKSAIGILAFIFSLIIPMFSYTAFRARWVFLKWKNETDRL